MHYWSHEGRARSCRHIFWENLPLEGLTGQFWGCQGLAVQRRLSTAWCWLHTCVTAGCCVHNGRHLCLHPFSVVHCMTWAADLMCFVAAGSGVVFD
jgi:hypothetical protein